MHSIPVTVVTQVSANRLVQLEAQCRDWNGPLSVVIYTSVIEISNTVGLSEASQAHLAQVVQDVELFTLMVGWVLIEGRALPRFHQVPKLGGSQDAPHALVVNRT